MGSNRLPFGLISGGYSRSEQYEWQQLALRQREQATREQPHRGANLNYPVHTPSRTEKSSPSFDRVCDYAKGDDGHIHATVSLCKVVPFNQGSSTQNRHYQEDRYLPTGFPCGHFSEIDEARHQSYMDSFHTKNKPDHTSAGRSCHRDEVNRAHTKKPFDELHPIHPAQRVCSPSEDFHDHLGISRNCRSAYNGRMLRTKQTTQSFQKNNSNGACVSRHGRNSCQKRYGDQLSGQKAKKNRQKRYGDQLAGQKVKQHMAYKEQPKRFCSLSEQDQQLYLHHEVHLGGSDVMKNDNREGNAETTKEVGHSGAKWNCHPKKNILTAATCGSTKSNENSDVSSPRYSSKTIASSNGPKQSEGSSNMKLESDKLPSVVGCTKGPRNMRTEEVSPRSLQHLPVTLEKDVHTKESDNTSPSELLRECLNIWRRRRLRKDSGAEAEKIIQTNKIGAVRNGRSASSGSSESDDENVSASESASGNSESSDENAVENSEKCRSATSPDGVRKRGEGRANCNKSSQNRIAKQGLKCNLEVPPEANLGEIMQQKEENKLPCYLLSTAHPDTMIQTSQNSCSDTNKIQTSWNSYSDTSKVDQAAALYPDTNVCQKAINDNLGARGKYKLGVSCEIKKKAEDDGAKWCDASKLDKGTANNCPNKPVNWSSRSDYRDIQGDTVNCNILRNEQVSSALAESENNIREKETEDYQPPQVLEVTSNQQISHQSDANRTNSGVARPANRASRFAIPDLNCLPSMITDEEEFEASAEVINQVTGDGSKPWDSSQSFFSVPFIGPAVQEEQFKQPEKNESIGGICKREVATGSRISDPHVGPPQVSTVEESSTSSHAFKSALAEFVKSILRPLWEDGLLSREVHKIIVKKAVEKVTVTLGPKVPQTEIAICRFLAEEESQSVEKLVQGYLDVYLGKQILKRTMPGSS